mmetsp:Transcript_14396/g.17502  ORF Transcript_14396/g.17502 Transcript_14396/m.17502 type:complete len:205 (+) Transcript_14396:770-1384(+)
MKWEVKTLSHLQSYTDLRCDASFRYFDDSDSHQSTGYQSYQSSSDDCDEFSSASWQEHKLEMHKKEVKFPILNVGHTKTAVGAIIAKTIHKSYWESDAASHSDRSLEFGIKESEVVWSKQSYPRIVQKDRTVQKENVSNSHFKSSGNGLRYKSSSTNDSFDSNLSAYRDDSQNYLRYKIKSNPKRGHRHTQNGNRPLGDISSNI